MAYTQANIPCFYTIAKYLLSNCLDSQFVHPFLSIKYTATMLSKYNLIWILVLVEQKHFKLKKTAFHSKKFICNFFSSYDQGLYELTV